jgi:hypothetical protein
VRVSWQNGWKMSLSFIRSFVVKEAAVEAHGQLANSRFYGMRAKSIQ